MQHAKLGLKKNPRLPSHCRYRKRLHSPEIKIIAMSATVSVGHNTPRVIALLYLIYACNHHGCIPTSHRYYRINQSFSFSSAKLRGLNCYKNESPSARSQSDDKTLY